MIDVQIIRDNPELIKEKAKQKVTTLMFSASCSSTLNVKNCFRPLKHYGQRRNEIAEKYEGLCRQT